MILYMHFNGRFIDHFLLFLIPLAHPPPPPCISLSNSSSSTPSLLPSLHPQPPPSLHFVITHHQPEVSSVSTMVGGLGGGGVKLVQSDGMMQSPLYSTMLGGQKHPCRQSVGQPSGGVGLVHVGRQTGPHSEYDFPWGHTRDGEKWLYAHIISPIYNLHIFIRHHHRIRAHLLYSRNNHTQCMN